MKFCTKCEFLLDNNWYGYPGKEERWCNECWFNMKKDYKQLANDLRKTVLGMTFRAQSSHIGSNFSCADILTVLYDIADLTLVEGGITKDIIVVKSWAAANVYACLVAKGLLPQEAIDKYGEEGTLWTTILDGMPPYIPFGTGAMGYHLPAAVGFALAKKVKKEEGTVYCLISDGELNIGSTWEALALANHHELDNLVLIIDKNGLQAMASTREVLDMEPVKEKIEAFGWTTREIPGHNYEEIESALRDITPGTPTAIIANTIKGKGVSFMEGDNLWHYSHVNKETLDKALEELNEAH